MNVMRQTRVVEVVIFSSHLPPSRGVLRRFGERKKTNVRLEFSFALRRLNGRIKLWVRPDPCGLEPKDALVRYKGLTRHTRPCPGTVLNAFHFAALLRRQGGSTSFVTAPSR